MWIALVAVLAWAALAGVATADSLTNAGSALRDGWYGDQPQLSPAVVSGGTFGQLWKTKVTGEVYAQPLVYDKRVIAVTEKNWAYSLDPETGAKSWGVQLPHSAPYDPTKELHCNDLRPWIGATATPVIDPATGTIYLTHKAYASGSTTEAEWWLDALDATTGQERAGFPVKIEGSAQNAPSQTFNATHALQRPGLLLMDGVVYAAFGGHCDVKPYQGWVFGVSTQAGLSAGQRIRARWVAVTSGDGAGIWQAGQGLMSDGSGHLFVATGNEGSPTPPLAGNTPGGLLGESIVRLDVQPDGTLRAGDFFAPYDADWLDQNDADFASGGITALRDDVFGSPTYPHIAVAVGKAGYVYLLDRTDLGGIGMGSGGGDDVIQRIGPYGGVWSRPGVWPGDGGWVIIPTASGNLDYVSSAGLLNFYRFGRTASGKPTLTRAAQSSDAFGFGSSAPVITSDGLTSGSAIAWVVWMPAGDGIGAQLRAYDPVPRGGQPQLLWSAPIDVAAKFNTPGVGDGRIYVGTRDVGTSYDGYVVGFGAPVTAALDAPATTFPTTTVGQTSTQTVTITAHQHVVISDVSASPAAFAAQTAALGLPRTLESGDKLGVPVTFTPAAAGAAAGSLTITTTDPDQGSFSSSLTGAGLTPEAKLAATPPVVSFEGTTVGRTAAATMTFANQGGQPLTINTVGAPSAPFSIQPDDLPAPGQTIGAGQQIVVPVQFAPTASGQFTGRVTLATTGGTATVALSGTAGSPKLQLSPAGGFAFGDVAVGQSAEREVTATNPGDAALTITKSKPPTAAPFTVVAGLDEGTTIAPGASRTLRVRFTPAEAGAVTDAWVLTGDDGSGVHELAVAGTGTVPGATTDPTPAPPATGDPLLPPAVGPDLTGLSGGTPITTTVAPNAKVHPRLAVSVVRLSRDGRRVAVSGRAVTTASGALTVTLTARVGRRHVTRVAHLRLRRGRFSASLLLPRAARHFSSLRVSARFAGSARVRAGSASRVLARPR